MTQEDSTIEEASVFVDGARIHYERAGTGQPLLLLHGLVGSAKNWRRNIGFLAQDSSVFALDLFNMGQSDRVPGLDAGLSQPPIELLPLWTRLDFRRLTSPPIPMAEP